MKRLQEVEDTTMKVQAQLNAKIRKLVQEKQKIQHLMAQEKAS